jgi:guanine deaminase
MLRAGTTTPVAFGTIYASAVDDLFAAAEKRNMRIIAGRVGMDKTPAMGGQAPNNYHDTAQSFFDESKTLIDRWHNKGRLLYASSPRFAPSSTRAQLKAAAELLKYCPTCYMQTHLSENLVEVADIREQFPEAKSYLDVYCMSGLCGPRSLFGHSIHLSSAEWDMMKATGSIAVHCPTSNNYLGSGLFNFGEALRKGAKVAVGTDVGAGTSNSLIRTLGEAYKVAMLQNTWLATVSPTGATMPQSFPIQASASPSGVATTTSVPEGDVAPGSVRLDAIFGFYLLTRGNAEILNLSDKIGSFAPGMEADFVVVDRVVSPQLKYQHSIRAAEKGATFESLFWNDMFSLMIEGGTSSVVETYVMGKRQTYDV